MNKNVKTILAVATLGLFCFAQVGWALTPPTKTGTKTAPAPTSPAPTSPAPTSPVPTSPVPTSPVPVPTSPIPATPK